KLSYRFQFLAIGWKTLLRSEIMTAQNSSCVPDHASPAGNRTETEHRARRDRRTPAQRRIAGACAPAYQKYSIGLFRHARFQAAQIRIHPARAPRPPEPGAKREA